MFTRGPNVVPGTRGLSPWRRASRRSWSRRWTAGSPWTTRGGWWSSTRPPSGSLAPPRPGDGPAAGRAHHLPAAAPGASGRAGPLPGSRRGTVAGQDLELTRGARRRQRASPSSFPSPRSRCRASRCSPRACATSPAANKPGPNSRPRASGCANPSAAKPGRPAGGVAHDFNSLLGVTLFYAAFVVQRAAGDPAATAGAEQIRAAAEQGAVQPAGARRAFRGADRRSPWAWLATPSAGSPAPPTPSSCWCMTAPGAGPACSTNMPLTCTSGGTRGAPTPPGCGGDPRPRLPRRLLPGPRLPHPAGLTLPWSSGAVEGHVNRIKMLKRQMYGRASPDLLRRRILLAD